jgi:hypothetical protein
MTCKKEVESINDSRRGNNRGIGIVQRHVDIISVRDSVRWSQLSTRKDLPYNVEVLKK